MKSADYIVAYVVQYMSKGVVYTVMYLLYHFWMPREIMIGWLVVLGLTAL